LARNIGIDARKLTDFGIGTYINNLVRSLADIDQENRYVLFVGTPGREILSDLPDNFRLVFENSPVYSIKEQVALSWKLHRLKLDLYHATHYVLPAMVSCRVVVTIHDIIHLLYPEFLPNRMAFLYAQRMIRRSLKRGDRIIADSRNTRTDLMDYFETDGRKIDVVYPGVAETFRRQLGGEAVQQVLADHGVDGPYLLFVGNPKPHKNLDNVVRAFAEVIRRDAFEGDLVCVGGRDEAQQRVLHHAESLGIADRVRLLGHVEEEALPAIYQGARLFLYPTLYEGFGLPVVEAMASGVPVITSNTSSLHEVANGYASLVDPLNVEQMADAIVAALRDDSLRERLITAGKERSSQFSWRQTAQQTLEVYQSALLQDYPTEVVS
jgi:glycosyltransferase involved in cell wall biosynthesis